MILPTCEICEESYRSESRIPKNLNCGHVICPVCASKLFENPEVKCPTCRQPIEVKDRDVNNLVTNFGMLKIIREIEESGKNKKIDTAGPTWCNAHQEVAKFICVNTDCDVKCKLMCRTCEEFGDHKDHKRGLLRDEVNMLKAILKKSEGRLSKFIDTIENSLRDFEKAENSLSSDSNAFMDTINEIKGHYDSMRKNIDVREQKSIEELGILAERQLMENRNKVGALKSGHRYFEDKLAEIKRLSLLDESILINEAGNIKSMADATESLVQNPSANTPIPLSIHNVKVELPKFQFC
ncbi:RING-type domain-containing protein [Caenorhabditis elegans]|uniref:RING-type domain-containing protein n=1 Tax=Caenorhabditis elegans TaxID=6239 RepID=Q8MQB4_CAEEL|nr:RING-type domain-containing protein [Caenorhabditis elegans]CCD63333.1 RING-type domain-containing protein [Caenorhabditis elegans]|eukprot:NP_741866.1 Uncharacterized protein CELE_C28G1.6 [Caenorhabditis elegans]